MFREYAIDPEVLKGENPPIWLLDFFGWEEGRPLCKYPSGWINMVRNSLNCQPVKKASIVERLLRFKYIKRTSTEYQREFNWLKNALNLHEIMAFHNIISYSDQPYSFVLSSGEVNKDNLHIPSEIIEREAEVMMNSIKLLLQTARVIKLIDPHFDYTASRFRNVIKALLQVLEENRYPYNPKIEIYTRCENDGNEERWANNILDYFEGITDREVVVIILPRSEMHNRYILTDKSGVMFGAGLDEGTGSNTTKDTISILNKDSHLELNREYSLEHADIVYSVSSFS